MPPLWLRRHGGLRQSRASRRWTLAERRRSAGLHCANTSGGRNRESTCLRMAVRFEQVGCRGRPLAVSNRRWGRLGVESRRDAGAPLKWCCDARVWSLPSSAGALSSRTAPVAVSFGPSSLDPGFRRWRGSIRLPVPGSAAGTSRRAAADTAGGGGGRAGVLPSPLPVRGGPAGTAISLRPPACCPARSPPRAVEGHIVVEKL